MKDEFDHAGAGAEADVDSQGPGLADAVRFLYRKRIKLGVWFILFFAGGSVLAIRSYLASPRLVQGTLGLNFRGIEKHEYPSGKKFSVEDLRGPDVLVRALGDAGFSEEGIDVRQFAAHVYVTPLVPSEILSRWKKQERDGVRREEYFPNEFQLALDVGKATDHQRIRLFDALVERYRERIKFDVNQKPSLGFVALWNTSYEKLAEKYDFWDIPALFDGTSQALATQIESLIEESLEFHESKYQLAFRDIARDLGTWQTTRLEALQALTYQGRLVKNRDLLERRLQYQVHDLDIRIRQKSEEANENIRLIGVVDRPKTLLADQLGNRNKEGMPVLDVTVLERLLKSDYVGPVVERIIKLQTEMQAMKATKERLEQQLTWLPKSSNITLAQLPAGHKELIQSLTSELDGIIKGYNKVLDQYVTSTITGLVVVQQAPTISRLGYPMIYMLLGVAGVSVLASVCALGLEHLFQSALQGEGRARNVPGQKF